MSSEQASDPTPTKARLETIHMLDELSGYLVGRQPMGDETKRLLESAVSDQKAQQQLFLGAVAAHKMHRFPKLLQAIDFLREKMMSPEILIAAAADPKELRKHLQKLLEMEEFDLSFLTQSSGTQATKHGHSEDPQKQYNIFFANTVAGSAVLPNDLSNDGRRNIASTLQALLSMAGSGGLPKPPKSSAKNARADLVNRVLNAKGRGNGDAAEAQA